MISRLSANRPQSVHHYGSEKIDKMKKRKRKNHDQRVVKCQKTEDDDYGHPTWALLRYYYPKVLTLRQYLVWALSKSKKRQRRVLHYGVNDRNGTVADPEVVTLLDTIAVGTARQAEVLGEEAIDKEITLFTQQRSGCTATISPTQGALKQSEVRHDAQGLLRPPALRLL